MTLFFLGLSIIVKEGSHLLHDAYLLGNYYLYLLANLNYLIFGPEKQFVVAGKVSKNLILTFW